MVPGSTALIPPVSPTRLGGFVLPVGSTVVTAYVSDTQFVHLGCVPFTNNPLFKRYIPPSDRSVIATQTAGVFVHELLRQIQQAHHQQLQPQSPAEKLRCEVKGDVADTPAKTEIARLEQILSDLGIDVEGYTRGNHSSWIMTGVVNLSSPYYDMARKMPLIGGFSLDEQLEQAAGSPGNVLTQRGTMQAMYRIVNHHRREMQGMEHREANELDGPKTVATAIDEADYDSYKLLGIEETVPFTPANQDRAFQTFWRPSRATTEGANDESRFWQCVVNYDIADEKQNQRGTKVNPFYLQASETCRFQAEDGAEYPVYTISIDGLDHNHLFAAIGSQISELQARLIELFMDQMRRENPRARFKISSHFSASEITGTPWYFPWRRRRNKRGRELFRKILAREDVILYSYGHTHERAVVDLNNTLKLGRKTPLMEINVPSLIDDHPGVNTHNNQFHDARALVLEKLRVDQKPDGTREIVIDLEYRGLDRDDIEGRTEKVEKALKLYAEKHGYIRAMETVAMLRRRHWFGWIKSHLKRVGEAIHNGFLKLFYRPSQFADYWRKLSITQYAIDNFTVVSTVNQFNEAYHLLPFLESVARFIGKTEDPGQQAVRGQLLSLRRALIEVRTVRLHEFEEALARGDRPHDLQKFHDLYRRAKTHKISNLLMQLRPGSEARAFAILAGLDASRGEFEYHKKKPTQVPNHVPTIRIPIAD